MKTNSSFLHNPNIIIKENSNTFFSFISPFTNKTIECFVYNQKEKNFEKKIKEYLLLKKNIHLENYDIHKLKNIFIENKNKLHQYIENNPDNLKFQELYILDTIEILDYLNTPGQGFCKKIDTNYGLFLNFFSMTENIEANIKKHIKENYNYWKQIFNLKSLEYYNEVFRLYEKDFLLYHELGHARAIHEYISLEFEREMEADYLAILLLNKYISDFKYKDFIISLLLRRGIKKTKDNYYINHYTDYALLFLLKNLDNIVKYKHLENEDIETSSLKMLKTFREENFYNNILKYYSNNRIFFKSYNIKKIKTNILSYGEKYVKRNI